MNWRKPFVYFFLYAGGSRIPAYLKKIRAYEQLDSQQLDYLVEDKLRKLLWYAYNNVPYYNDELVKCGVISGNKVILEQFGNIPILTKDIIRTQGAKLYSKHHKSRKSYQNTSGGSTGEPILFLQDKVYKEWNYANKIYYKLAAGQDIGEKELRFWGSDRDLLEGKEKLSIRLRNWLYNRKEFNTFLMSDEEMFRYVSEWNEYDPCWVEAYVQSIYEFAGFIEKNKLKIKSPKNGILTSAGTLYPEMKETIQKVFKCRVYNRYGSREVGDIACGDDTLKISCWNQHVEIIDKKVYITNLNNYSMPLVRYDIGDIAEFGKSKFELKRVLGRETQIFKTKSGKMIDGAYFRHALFFFDWVSKYQIIQKDYESIIFKIVNNKPPIEEDLRYAEDFVKSAMGKNCIIKWEFVKDIKPTKSGKYLYTISRI